MKNPYHINLILAFTVLATASTYAQPEPEGAKPGAVSLSGSRPDEKVVVITGARFSYPLVEKWIDEYNKVNPHVQVIVESRGSADPLKYDILVEVYEHEDSFRKNREYIYVGRYALLPVANRASSFANFYATKGLDTNLIRHIFFHDIFSERSKQNNISEPYTVYRRLQRAGVPIVLSEYFGYTYDDMKGTLIAGADSHVLRATLRDSMGVSYLPVTLIYDEHNRKVIDGLVVLPVDLNGNKKVSDEEKFYDTVDRVVQTLEALEPGKIKNIPVEHLHLSIDRDNASDEAVNFLKWVNEHGQDYLHEFGYLKPVQNSDKGRPNDFSSQRAR